MRRASQEALGVREAIVGSAWEGLAGEKQREKRWCENYSVVGFSQMLPRLG